MHGASLTFSETLVTRITEIAQGGLKYSKASSYTASSNTDLSDARFLIGSKTI